jgi:uncharacterized protein (DUF608 family)
MSVSRRGFLGIMGTGAVSTLPAGCTAIGPNHHTPDPAVDARASERGYNGPYAGPFLERIAFPLGGIGAGMICMEGSGALSHVSIANEMDLFNEPNWFAALCVKGTTNTARVLEGPVPDSKIFWAPSTGNGAAGRTYGLPRFGKAEFNARFPFGTTTLQDDDVPLQVSITGWSPFIPGDSDNSSLPVGALEYRFKNTTGAPIEAVFSYNVLHWRREPKKYLIKSLKNGFIREWRAPKATPWDHGALAFSVDDDNAVVNHNWFRGDWWDPLTMAWNSIQRGELVENPPADTPGTGASISVPITVPAGGEHTLRLMVAWYAPETNSRTGADPFAPGGSEGNGRETFAPWYSGRFSNITEVADYWRSNYTNLRSGSARFRDAFYDTTLPPEVVEAVAANLTILKSPTVMRQTDGKLWCWEGCRDDAGCCSGSCTHVWNYAQAIAHLFPDLERSLRQTEFNESQNDAGHQVFRSFLPIRDASEIGHERHAASDGQLGGIMKIYREWRVSGNTDWLRGIWPEVKQSMDYCIKTWDPRGRGILEEPHHNTYDIEFWGPDGMCTGFYLGALTGAAAMADAVGESGSAYLALRDKGVQYLDAELFNGEYYFQNIQWDGLDAEFEALDYSANGPGYRNAVSTLNSEGPKYQYGTGCLSDVVLGFWMAKMCGLGDIGDLGNIRSSLKSIHKYNLLHDLSKHANPQRPSFALGKEAGLLLCTWPKGGALSIPFVYSNEVWTGIEYQVASHLMLEGMVQEGLDIVRACRNRYSGIVRNPFNEYECGHWYARAMSSYGLIQGLTGLRYDAVDKTLYIDSKIGDNFRCFLSTATGFGTAGLRNGRPFIEIKEGGLDVRKCVVSGKEIPLEQSA